MSELITLIQPAEQAPVSISECKADLRIEPGFTLDDALIESYILAATRVCSEMVGRKLINETWKLSLRHVGAGVIELPFQPVNEIVEIQYFDKENVSRTLDRSNLYLYNYDNGSTLEPVLNWSWPQVYSRRDAINITFKAGHGEGPESVPDTIKKAIRLIVVHWYEHRSSVLVGVNAQELPMAVDMLLATERRGWCA